MRIRSMGRVATVGDVWCDKLRAMVSTEQPTTRKLNQVVHDNGYHAIRVLGLSERRSLARFTPKSFLPNHLEGRRENFEMEGDPKLTTN